jgi:hypothetical protein
MMRSRLRRPGRQNGKTRYASNFQLVVLLEVLLEFSGDAH